MTIDSIKQVAEDSGITAIITNSNEKIETQLNRITGVENLPIMLISWDLQTTLTFNENGFLNNPSTNVVLLLMTKSEQRTKEEFEISAQEMASIFQIFVQKLNSYLVKYNTSGNQPLSNINYTLVPVHGLGKHSGILGKFTMIGEIINC